MKLHNALTHQQIVNLQGSDKIKRYSDGGRLYLEVTPKGYKYWRFQFRIGSKEKRLSLGVFPQVDIETARNKRDAYRAMIKEGRDPSENKWAQTNTQAIKYAKTRCFKDCYLEKGHHGCALNLIIKYNHFFNTLNGRVDERKIAGDYLKFMAESIDQLSRSLNDSGCNSGWVEETEVPS